jgi:hypothetical protein
LGHGGVSTQQGRARLQQITGQPRRPGRSRSPSPPGW